MKHLTFAFVTLSLLSSAAFSQPPGTLWTRTVTSEWTGVVHAICLTQDSGYAVTGECCGWYYHTVYTCGFVAKLNRAGQIEWQWVDNPGLENTCGYDIIETPDGGLVAVGRNLSGSGYRGLWAVRFTSQGDTVWYRSYSWGDSYSGEAYAVCLAPDGGYLIAGIGSISFCKLDSSGNMLWSRNWGMNFQDIAALPDGNFICVGQSGSSRCIIVKVTADGDSLWSRDCGTWCQSTARSVVATYDGGFAVGGSCQVDSNTTDAFLALFDSSGNHFLTRRCEHENSYAMDVGQTSDSGFVLVGGFPSEDSTRLIVLKTRPNTDIEWVTYWGGGNHVCANAVVQDRDSGFVIAGRWNYDTWYIAKLTANPLPVSGRTGTMIPENFTLSSFPNPFNPTTTISFSLPRASHTHLAVFDILGREIAVLTDKMYPAGEHELIFDGSLLPSGIYFARMENGGQFATVKMLLCK